MPIKGNKGEWSEFYAFIKILTDGKVFNADKNLEILRDNFYLVLKIIREESSGAKSYDISRGNGEVSIYDKDGKKIDNVRLENIKTKVADIFQAMKNASGTTFGISLAEIAMEELHCSQIRASSGRKADLVIVLHDKKSPDFPELGFSIKSMLGSPSTLLNASGATNFVYRVVEKKQKDASGSDLNSATTVRDATTRIYGSGGDLEFCGMDSEIFRRNLIKIDSKFPEIIAEIVKCYHAGNGIKLAKLVDCVVGNEKFLAGLNLTREDLVFKIKHFLSGVALGMMPSKIWDGYTEAHGGYIIVKENGEVVCYHLYNRDKFEDYLFNNVKLDTPSMTRHKFGKIYRENGEKKIKLNLQIRFIK